MGSGGTTSVSRSPFINRETNDVKGIGSVKKI